MKTQFRIIDRSKNKLEKHINYCEYMLEICNRNSNNLKSHYFKKQIEITKRKLKTFKSE
jgi:hypothetical protein